MSHTPLPLGLVESLFARLLVTYGHPFLNQYEGLDMGVVHADWAEKLAGFQQQGEGDEVDAPAIAWALDNLTPGRPPNALDFKQLCRAYRAPEDHPLGLPAPPRAVPERFQNALAQLAAPLEDTRPEPVRRAYAFINKWGTEGVRLNPTQQGWLKHYRAIATRWEADQAREKAKDTTHAAE